MLQTLIKVMRMRPDSTFPFPFPDPVPAFSVFQLPHLTPMKLCCMWLCSAVSAIVTSYEHKTGPWYHFKYMGEARVSSFVIGGCLDSVEWNGGME